MRRTGGEWLVRVGVVDPITRVVSTTHSVDEGVTDTERTVCQMRYGDGSVLVCQCVHVKHLRGSCFMGDVGVLLV